MSGARSQSWGRTREALAKRLRDLGYIVHDLWATQGYPRSGGGGAGEWDDCHRWEGLVQKPGGLALPIVSMDTMTKCVRNGFDVKRDGPWYEVSARASARG